MTGDWSDRALLRIRRRLPCAALLVAYLFLGCVVSSHAASGGGPSVSASVEPQWIMEGEQASYSVTVSSSGGGMRVDSCTPPRLPDGLRYISRTPSVSRQFRSDGFSFSQSVVYTFAVLALKPGRYTIPPAEVVVQGKRLRTGEVVLVVGRGAVPGAGDTPGRRGGVSAGPGDSSADGTSTAGSGGGAPTRRLSPYFVHATVVPREAYVGQPVAYVGRVFVLRSLLASSQAGLVDEPVFEGFVAESMERKSRSWRGVRIAGVEFAVLETSRCLLTPSRPGEYTITPERIQVYVKKPRRRRRHRSFFDSFFDDDFFFSNASTVVASGKSVRVEVKPLPSKGKPADFSGIVADSLTVEASISRARLKENESLTLTLVYKAKGGDLRSWKAPSPEVGDSFRIYNATCDDSVDVGDDGVSSVKKVEYVMVPRKAGDLKIGAVSISYFSPAAGAYQRVSSRSFELQVEAVPESEREEGGTVVLPGVLGKEVKVLRHDIEYIEESPDALEPWSLSWADETWYWILLLAPLALVAAVEAWSGAVRLLAARRTKLRASYAWYELKRRLASLRAPGDGAAGRRRYFNELEGAFKEYVGAKLGCSGKGLTLDQIARLLRERGVEERLVSDAVRFLEKVQECAFSPAGLDARSAQALKDECVAIAGELDRYL